MTMNLKGEALILYDCRTLFPSTLTLPLTGLLLCIFSSLQSSTPSSSILTLYWQPCFLLYWENGSNGKRTFTNPSASTHLRYLYSCSSFPLPFCFQRWTVHAPSMCNLSICALDTTLSHSLKDIPPTFSPFSPPSAIFPSDTSKLLFLYILKKTLSWLCLSLHLLPISFLPFTETLLW